MDPLPAAAALGVDVVFSFIDRYFWGAPYVSYPWCICVSFCDVFRCDSDQPSREAEVAETRKKPRRAAQTDVKSAP